MCLSFFLIDSKGIPFSYSFLTWGNTCVTINSSHHHCHRHHRGLGHGSAEKEQQWWIKSLIYRDLRRAKLVFGCRRGLYLSISLSTHHTNEVDIAYLYFLPFPPFFFVYIFLLHSFQQSLGVSLSLVSVFVFFSLLTKKTPLCTIFKSVGSSRHR